MDMDGYEAEDGESEDDELVSEDGSEQDSDDETIPKAVPIGKVAPINNEKRDPDQKAPSSSEVSSINFDSFSESSEYD